MRPYYAMSTTSCERDSSLICCKLGKENRVNNEIVRMNAICRTNIRFHKADDFDMAGLAIRETYAPDLLVGNAINYSLVG